MSLAPVGDRPSCAGRELLWMMAVLRCCPREILAVAWVCCDVWVFLCVCRTSFLPACSPRILKHTHSNSHAPTHAASPATQRPRRLGSNRPARQAHCSRSPRPRVRVHPEHRARSSRKPAAQPSPVTYRQLQPVWLCAYVCVAVASDEIRLRGLSSPVPLFCNRQPVRVQHPRRSLHRAASWQHRPCHNDPRAMQTSSGLRGGEGEQPVGGGHWVIAVSRPTEAAYGSDPPAEHAQQLLQLSVWGSVSA